MSRPLARPDADLILRHITDGLMIVDPAGRITYANESLCLMLGRAREELIGLPIDQVFDDESARRLSPVAIAACDDGAQVHFNIPITSREGQRGSYCFIAEPIRGGSGEVLGYLQNFRNMDALREMILDLEEVNRLVSAERDRAEQILESIGDGAFSVDAERRLQSFSRRMEEITGLAAADVLGRTCADVLRGTRCETDCPLVWTWTERERVERCRETIAAEDGRRIPVEVTTGVLRGEGGVPSGVAAFVRDRSEIERLRGELERVHSFHSIIGRSPEMQRVFEVIRTVAGTDATVLITGESGTGKDIVARAIHYQSERSEHPFIAVNCAALSESLLETELFGHVRGAFTGAIRDRPGRFELASRGTIFLDEIGDTSPAMQAKLLRVLETKTVERVGEARTRRTDVRILAATNQDLESAVRHGRFREDLYYRLSVVPLHLPPLRDRKEDVPLLVEHFIERHLERHRPQEKESFGGISARALAALVDYPWPGNVRELEHAIEYAVISTTTGRIERSCLPAALQRSMGRGESTDDPDRAGEADRLKGVLERNRWNMTRAARELGISRTTLWRRLKQHGVQGPRG